MSDHDAIIQANYAEVMERVAEACRKSGREPDSARLVAVTKYAELAWVKSLIALGHRELGESRPQQLVQRSELLPSDVDWHLIGHLQRNKVRAVLPHTGLVHSIDSTRLLERVDRIANEIGLSPQVLLEVNVSGEASKQGYGIDDLLGEWEAVRDFQAVRIAGLMTMAPVVDQPDDARPFFARLRQLRETLLERGCGSHELSELSMGMSGDFEAAIAEGATIVRVGSRLFKGLESP